jgi:hypothetical protein
MKDIIICAENPEGRWEGLNQKLNLIGSNIYGKLT